eukprot:COSAG02_NODE_2402_length_8943_cov_2.854138_2_plen_107_part_00
MSYYELAIGATSVKLALISPLNEWTTVLNDYELLTRHTHRQLSAPGKKNCPHTIDWGQVSFHHPGCPPVLLTGGGVVAVVESSAVLLTGEFIFDKQVMKVMTGMKR